MSDIPPSIIFDILSRLPVKSLCRFKCVSKHWFALINSRRFSQKHLSTINKKRLLIQDDILSSVELETISSLPDSLPEETDHPGLSPDIDYYMDPIVVGSCNGLVCIAYLNPSSMDLWLFNPSTRESKQIMDDLKGDVFGFGYEEGGDDYKVVKIPSSENQGHEVRVGDKVRVYSLRNDSWEDIESDFELSFESNMTKSASVNGAIHSVVCYDDGAMVIAAFDLVEGKFKTVPQPPLGFLLKEVDVYELSAVGELDGCLCLSIQTPMSVELWVMKSYNVAESWQKIFAFESVDVFDMQPLCCMVNDGTILVRVQFNILMFWDPKDGELKNAEIDCFDDGWNAEGIYMESVVSPIHISESNDEDKDLLEYWFQ